MTMQELVFVPGTPGEGAAKEPLVSVATITAVVSAVLSLGVSFGLSLSPEQTGAVVSVVTLLAPLVVALWGRRKVFAPSTVRAMVVQAAASGKVARTDSVQPANPDVTRPGQL